MAGVSEGEERCDGGAGRERRNGQSLHGRPQRRATGAPKCCHERRPRTREREGVARTCRGEGRGGRDIDETIDRKIADLFIHHHATRSRWLRDSKNWYSFFMGNGDD